jgi:hypothetical protein
VKIEIVIKAEYEDRWFLTENTFDTIENFYSEVDRHGVFLAVEKYTYYKQFIVIYKHKTFGYISSFNTQYRLGRFQ